ncbi:hypothetical protein [Rubellicoccus peritrichatus]|uniref:Uncharacterized protein n=1 Tax=Rubellicoccus peritrichatus TaxID=3080537 RepID=A0AAQ3QXF1_9BACT|nr:hypothetical protein [Puniceicoccus sp. CR14]WOO43623.1 hypothetical protein RZN69_11035 [Puniceicoccus sp. CR14]
MKYSFSYILIFLAPSLFHSTLLGQGANLHGGDLYEFRVVGWNYALRDMFYEVDGEVRDLPLYRRMPSPLQSVSGDGDITFFIPSEENEKKGKKPIVNVSLNPAPLRNLVMIWLDTEGQYQASILPDDPNFPGLGQLRLVNLTGQNLLIQCNKDTPVPLSLGSELVVDANDKLGGVGVKVAFQIQREGNWKLAWVNGIVVRPNERVTAYIAKPSEMAAPLERIKEKKSNSKVKPLELLVVRDAVSK